MSIKSDKLSVQEAAKFVGCSVSFIRNKLNDGILPHIKIGNRAYIESTDLERLTTPNHGEPKLV